MQLSPKQKEFWNAPYHRWNIKHGATRSGKTYMDYFIIPRSIRERHGQPGLIVLMGNTKGTLQRNVIDPMQDIFGTELVSSIRADNTATLFGERAYCLGADSKKHVERVRGMSIKYCYGDELVSWEKEVFEMLKSRLDKPYSRFDGTCNPKEPEHWVNQFLHSDADIFSQHYELDDNPFLDERVRAELKKEHRGVFYDRYIRGLWVAAEGLVFPYFNLEEHRWVETLDIFGTQVRARGRELSFAKISIGLDFGATGSMNTMHAIGIAPGYEKLTVLAEGELERGGSIDTEKIAGACADFCQMVHAKFGRYDWVFYDQAAPALGARVAAKLRERGMPWRCVAPCEKTPLESRPVTVDGLLCADRLIIDRNCRGLIKALAQLRWDEKNPNIPEDENTGNINDYWDSFNYFFSPWTEYINRR